MIFTTSNHYTAPNTMNYGDDLNLINKCFHLWTNCQRTITIIELLNGLPTNCLKLIQMYIETKIVRDNCDERLTLLETQSNCKMRLLQLCDSYKNAMAQVKAAAIASSQISTTTSTTSASQLFFNDSLLIDNTNNTNNNNNNHIASNNNNNNHNNNNNNNNNSSSSCDNCCNKKEKLLNDILDSIPMLRIGNHDAKSIYLSLIPQLVDDAHKSFVDPFIVQEILSYLLVHPALTTDDRHMLKDSSRKLQDIIEKQQCNHTEQISRTIAPPANIQSSLSLSSTTSSLKNHFSSNENLYNQSIYVPTSQSQDLTDGMSLNAAFLYETALDDLHVSFSKNGTECADFDADSDKSNTQIACCGMSDFLTVPNVHEHGAIKTRRSNSLTTTSTTPYQQLHTFTASTENLAMLNKPRSLSLSYESPCNSFVSSGSETRLDEHSKRKISSGMSNIGIWLKGLRLHKYQALFDEMTYENMMSITQEKLINKGVTQGATKKLLSCVQKLNERYALLKSMENELMSSTISIRTVVDELKTMVVTPMKPLDPSNPEDVPGHFFKVLILVCGAIGSKTDDKDLIESMVKTLEYAIRSEAFIGHLHIRNQLKDQFTRWSKLKPKFLSNYKSCGSSTGLNLNKPRFTSNSKTRKPGLNPMCTSGSNAGDHKSYRKNSNPLPMGHHQSKLNRLTNSTFVPKYHNGASNIHQMGYNKSSSYPNFPSNSNIGGPPSNYHRHSVSNLITIKPNPSAVASSIGMQSVSSSAVQSGIIGQHSHPSLLGTNMLSTSGNSSKNISAGSSTTYDSGSRATAYDHLPHSGQRSKSSGAVETSNYSEIYMHQLCMQMTQQAID